MKRLSTFNFVILLLLPFIISNCATAPKGYLNKGDYLYVKGNRNDASIVLTAKLVYRLYDLPMENICPLDLKITRVNGEYSGWNGVELLEILPGSHIIYVGVVGRGIPHFPLHVKPNRVYLLNCEGDLISVGEVSGALYIPQRRIFSYEGREYAVP